MAYFRRNQGLDIAAASNTTLNEKTFFKLLALGLFDILITLPLTILQLVGDILQRSITSFWPGWNFVHASFSTIPKITSEEWKSAGTWTVFGIKFDEWVNPISAIAFFLLFGITDQKLAWYRSIFRKVIHTFGFIPRVDPVASVMMSESGPMVDSARHKVRATVM